MEVPLHPAVAHLPLVTVFLLPVLILVFALMIRSEKLPGHAWLVIVGLQLFATGSGYVALETGENEEHTVEKVVSKKLIHEHEEASEVFVGSTVLALALGIVAIFIRKEYQILVQSGVFVLTLVSVFLGYRAGVMGGELVYVHGAGRAYEESSPVNTGLLPTPGQNTSESPFPVDENESLKADDNDYGGADEMPEGEDGPKEED